MKLTFFLLTVVFLNVQARGLSQGVTLSGRDMPLQRIFSVIKKQTGYAVFANRDLLVHARPVTVNVQNMPLESFLEKVLEGQPLQFRIAGHSVILSERTVTETATPLAMQPPPVSGVVRSPSGTAVGGATIRIRGRKSGTITSADGSFSLPSLPEDAVLLVSCIGYESMEIAIRKTGDGYTATAVNKAQASQLSVKTGQQVELTITLAIGVSELDQAVVVGYGEVKRRDLTGSVSVIKPREFADLPGLRVDNLLQGKIAGADIISSEGEPGAPTTIRIRGTRSINADNEPLYVIDGIIDAGDLNDLNPDDIASIEVLKDASSTAIYGSRGANGVILITTKQGKAGKDVVTFRSDLGFAQLPKYLDVMNVWEWADMINENARLANPTNPNLRYDLDTLTENTDWTRAVTRIALFNTNTVTASGGSDQLRYYLSGNYADQQGIVKESGLKRYQFRLNLDKDFSRKLKAGIRLNYSHVQRDLNKVDIGSNSGYSLSTLTIPPVMKIYDEEGGFEDWNPAYGNSINSPVSLIELMKNESIQRSFWGNAFLEYSITKGLQLRSSLSVTSLDNRTNKYEPGTLPARALANSGGRATKTTRNDQQLLSETTLSFDRRWSSHHLNAVAGWTYQRKVTESMFAQGQGYFVDALEDNSIQSADKANTSMTSGLVERAMVSGLARVNYDYKGKYYLTLTGRADGASNFATAHKWAFFPSGAVKWNIHEEPWMRGLQPTISQLAARLSYGASGNQGINPYESLASLDVENNGYIFDGSLPLAYQFGNLTNSGLTWETSRSWNAGIDLSLLNGRINITADAYYTRTEKLLLDVQMPQQTGYTSRLINLGKTENKGLEFLVNTLNVKAGAFRWETNITAAFNKQQVLDLGPLVRVTTLVNYTAKQYPMYAYQVGLPVSSLFGAVYAGTWKSTEEIEQNKTDKKYVSTTAYYGLGRPRYIDQNGDGVLNDSDIVYLGQAEPKVYGGFGNTFTYKNFSLDLYFTYQLGAKMYNATEFNMGSGTILTNQYRYMLDRYHPQNNPNSDLPRVNSKDHVPNSRFVHDASYLRFKSFRFGYTFDAAHSPIKAFRGMSFFVTGTNLLLWTEYNGYDPDVSATPKASPSTPGTNNATVRRNDDGAYPNNRTLAFTVSVKL